MSKKVIPTAALAALFAVPSFAASVSVRGESREVTVDEVADGAPAGSLVHNYFMDSDADILRIGDVNVTGTVYNNPRGSDSAPINPPFVAVFPALAADSFVTTPGETAIAGDGGFNTNSSFFDTSNDGPVSDFNFARLTTQGPHNFQFVVSVAGSAGPEVFAFSVGIIPEPTALTLLLAAGMCVVGCRRRHN